MKQLRLTGVSNVDFGRHRGFSCLGLDHAFVVVYGANESGKSTLAEFLTWSIGGPFRTYANGSERFRIDGVERVGGRVEATLGGERLDLEARFKLRLRDKPNDLRSGTIAARSLDSADAFGSLFSGLTPEDYVLIYRIYGVDLSSSGTENDFSALFSKFASGGSTSTLEPRAQVDWLIGKERELEVLRKSRNQELKALVARIRDAEKRPEQVVAEQQRIAVLAGRVSEIGKQLAAMQAEQALIARVIAGVGALRRQHEARASLSALAEVPPAWAAVLPSVADIKRLRDEFEDVEEKQRAASAAAGAAIARTGLRAADLEGKRLSAAERSQMQAAAAAVHVAVTAQSAVETHLQQLVLEHRRVESEANSAAGSVGLSREQAEALANQSGLLDGVTNEGLQWANAAQAVARARAEAADAEAALQTVRENVPAPSPPSPPVPAPKWGLNPFVVAAVVAVVGMLGLVSPWASLGSGLVAAVVFAVVRSNRKPVLPQQAPVTVPSAGAPPEVAALAARMGVLASARSNEGDRARRVSEVLAVYGVVPPTPEDAPAVIAALKNLAGLVDAARRLSLNLNDARGGTERAAGELQRCRETFATMLRERGAEGVVSVDSFPEWLVEYENALNASELLQQLVRRQSERAAQLQPLLAPIADEVSGMSWGALLERFTSFVELSARHNKAEQEVREAGIAVTGAGMTDGPVRALLERFPMGDGLSAQQRELSGRVQVMEDERIAATEERTRLTVELEARLQTEVLPELLLQRGELEEAQAESEQDLVVARLARELLGTAIDDFEKQNQDPVIQHAQRLVEQVVPSWGTLMMTYPAGGKPTITRDSTSGRLLSDRLSDGARALLHLGIRLAFAERDSERRGLALPLICDDPFAHFDDDRTRGALELLRDTSKRHQVILFTCETGTRTLAADLGAHVINL
ncbi:unannotated protein [freshwater metagenome]|uniref:Unannotated protein n=1 Tax=freshwater metagenome TaxID=449393 RepID=A0A6J7UM30_9ZZZZ